MDDRAACDVLVAGSGAGGFAAALTARHQGLDVIMVEKEPLFGGTTAYSAGVIWIPVNPCQQAAGLADSREDALAYLTHHVGNRLDRAKAEAFVDNGSPMFKLFEREGFISYSPALTWADYHPDQPGASHGGRSLCPDDFDGRKLGPWFDKLRPPLETMTAFGGMMVGRNDLPHVFQMTRSVRSATHVARMLARHARDRLGHRRGTRLVNGNALIASLAMSALQRGIPLWLNAPLVELARDGGRVTGAIVEREGQRLRIETRRGVVLACGGFPASAALRRRLYGHIGDGKSHVAIPPAGNSGDGLRLAQSCGGAFHDDVAQPAAWVPASLVPQRDGSFIPFPHFFDRGKPGYICVDRHGLRFVNEAMSYHVFVPAMIEACRGDIDAQAWIICDHRAIRRLASARSAPRPCGCNRSSSQATSRVGGRSPSLPQPAASMRPGSSARSRASTTLPGSVRTRNSGAALTHISVSMARLGTSRTMRRSARSAAVLCGAHDRGRTRHLCRHRHQCRRAGGRP